MRRLLQGWLLLSCVLATGQVLVRESDTRARLIDGKTTISLAVTNVSAKPVDVAVELRWLGPDDDVYEPVRRSATVAPGDSILEIPAPLSGEHNPLFARLLYRIRPGSATGALNLVSLADYAFTLSLIVADEPRPDTPFDIHALAVHPLTGRPLAGVEVKCGPAGAVTDAAGVAKLRVTPDPDDSHPNFTVAARNGDFHQTGTIAGLKLRTGSVRIDLDKPLYQPGQTMHIRVLSLGGDGRARAGAEHDLQIRTQDAESVYAAALTTSRFGVASADWAIPANAKAGVYVIDVDGERSRLVEIRRYELPSFRVTARLDRPYYLRHEKAVIEVSGEYLFGKPVAAGSVRILEAGEQTPALDGPLDAAGRFRGTLDTGDVPPFRSNRYIDRHFTAYLTDDSTHRTEQREFDLRVSESALHLYVNRVENTLSGRRVYASCYSPQGDPAVCDLLVDDNHGRVWARGRANRLGVARIDLPWGEDDLTLRASAPGASPAVEELRFEDERPALWLDTDRTLYRAGEPVRCRIETKRKEAALVLLAWNERGDIVFSRGLRVAEGRAEIEVPYDRRFLRRLSFGVAEAGYGITAGRTVIFPRASALALRAAPAQASYRPGETAHIEFQASAEAALGLAIVDQSVFERARTDVVRRNWFEWRDSGDSIGGIAESDLLNLDPARIDADLDLAAEALQPHAALRNETEDFASERTERFTKAAEKALAPVKNVLDALYIENTEYPRNQNELEAALRRQRVPPDSWLRPYILTFATEGVDDVLRFSTAGPDKQSGTQDDFCPLTIRRKWFGSVQSLGREILRNTPDYPASIDEFVRALETGGLRFSAFRDRWGEPLRIEIEYDRDQRLFRALSAGPDRTFGTADDFRAAEFTGPYFAAMAKRISRALDAAPEWPRTEEAFRALVHSAGLDAAWQDPLGGSHYLRLTTTDLGSAKRTLLIAEIRSVGEDRTYGTYDDFTVASFDHIPMYTEPQPAPKPTPSASVIRGTGSVVGTVMDASGSTVARAVVTLGPAHQTETDVRGRYEFRGIAPGVYRLEFRFPGFENRVLGRVPVEANHVTRVDGALEIGVAMETITVTSLPVMIQSESAAISASGRQFATLAALTPGASSPAGETFTPRVREYFPETLYWQPELVTDTAGRASIEVKLADTITNWRLEAIGSTIDGRIAFASTDIRAFQPFQVELDVPATLTAGDEIDLPVPVRNYLDQPQRVKLEASVPQALSLRQPLTQPGPIGASSSANAVLALRAAASVDSARLRVSARSRDGADAIEKPVSIHPDGQRRELVLNVVTRPGQPLRFEVPASAIPGSLRAEVKFFPSPMARVRASMDALLSRPYGCGEQTISSTYPNLLLLDALKQAGVKSAAVEARAMKYLRAGYQRLLGYQDASGGFTYWGHGDPDPALTAYAIEFLRDARDFIGVDQQRVDRAKDWLAKQNPGDIGARAVRARGLARERSLDSGVLADLSAEMQRGAAAGDPYPVAAFALAALDGGQSDLAAPAIERLIAMAQDDRGAAFWSAKEQTPFHGWGRSGEVETTALVVTALSQWRKAGRASGMLNELTDRGALFLMRRADSSGAWPSGQATVRALTALLGIWSPDAVRAAVPIRITANGAEVGAVTLPGAEDAAGPLALDITKHARAGANEIALSGARSLQVQINATWYETWDQPRPASKDFSLAVNFDKPRAAINDAIACDVRVSRPSFRGYGMMIAEVGLPPGAEADRASLTSLLGQVSSYEVAPDRVTFYLWPYAAETKFRFLFRPRFAMHARAAQSALYDYYNPDERVTLAPETFTVE